MTVTEWWDLASASLQGGESQHILLAESCSNINVRGCVRGVLGWGGGDLVERGFEGLGRFGDGDGCSSLDTGGDDLLDGKGSSCDLSHDVVVVGAGWCVVLSSVVVISIKLGALVMRCLFGSVFM